MFTNASRSMIITNAVLMVASGGAVVLRIVARRRKALLLEVDDYLVMAAWIFAAILAITNIVGVPVGGFGVPFESLSEAKAIVFLKILFVLQFWYIIAVALIKLSVLCFYSRIFSTTRFPRIIKVVIGLTIAWLISFLFATFFQVWPLWCNWITCAPTTNYPVMYVCCSVTDILLDISILCLPSLFIRNLQISRSKKILIGAIFGLGIFCVVSSIARLAYAVGFVKVNIVGDYAVNFDIAVVNMIMWSGIEACASVICANLPCYGPLISKTKSLPSTLSTFRSAFSIPKRARNRFWLSSLSSRRNRSSSAENIITNQDDAETVIEGVSPNCPRQTSETDLEMGKITVKTVKDGDTQSPSTEWNQSIPRKTTYPFDSKNSH